MREGRTTGFPLVAPWVNRLATPRYVAGGVEVDVSEAVAAERVRTDGNGLPIHGFVSGRVAVDGRRTPRPATGSPSCGRSLEVDDPAFPFPHRLTVAIAVRPTGLDVVTDGHPAVEPRRCRSSFGWHPYLHRPGHAARTLAAAHPALATTSSWTRAASRPGARRRRTRPTS